MYLRKLWLIIAAFMVMASPLAFGLGLGEITLNSNLNQPLDAEIKLLQVRDLSQQEIFAQLGSADDFSRRGIERIFFLQDIRFEVRLNNPGGPIIKLTSQKPVVEPFLIFIVQMEWPSGRAQREYTLLMDLPVFTDRPATPVQQPQAQPQPVAPPVQQQTVQRQPAPPVQPQRSTASTPPPPLPTRPDTPQPVRQQPRPAAPAPARTAQPQPLSPSLQSGETYNVVANDTLWEIALRTRPNRGVSVQQTMLALQRLNPNAFINSNINLLREGQVLRIPSEAEIQQLDQRSAVNEVAYQNAQWSGDSDGIVRGAELQGSRTVASSDDDDDTRRGQLTLASPGDTTRATGERSSGGLSASEREALENELAIALEQLDSGERENAELNERVEELEEQISTMERLIEVSNEEMRTLQLALQQNALSGDSEEPTLAEDVSEEIVTEEEPADSSAAAPADVPAATPQTRPAPVAPPVAPAREESIVDILMDYIWYIGIGVIIILLGAFYMWHRKTQAEMASFDEFEDDDFDDQDNLELTGDDNYYEEPEAEDDFDLGLDEEPIEEAIPEEKTTPTEAQTGDAVGEADIYIAYGKYDQAEEMLQRAIVKEPDNVDARLKLLEVYSETTNASKFDAEYGKLLALGDASANARAAELRGNIPGIGQYKSEAGSTTASPGMDFGKPPARDEDEFDLSLDLDDDGGAASQADDEFNFDLDEPGTASSTDQDDDIGGMDFNLDLDDDSELSLDTEEDQELSLDLDDDAGDSIAFDMESDGEELTLDLDDDSDLSFDLDADESEFDKEFDAPEEDSAVNETLNRDFDSESKSTQGKKEDDDIFSDLEFSAAAVASEQDKDDSLAKEANAFGGGGSSLSDDGDDDFDLDLGDVDLAALDQEMDALVGDLDDVDEDDVAVSPTDVVPALSEDDLDSAGFSFDEDSDKEDLAATTPQQPAVSIPDEGLDEDSELDFLADTDEVATKLDLARAYIDMGDQDGAKDILSEVASEGSDEQKQEAKELLGKIS